MKSRSVFVGSLVASAALFVAGCGTPSEASESPSSEAAITGSASAAAPASMELWVTLGFHQDLQAATRVPEGSSDGYVRVDGAIASFQS